MKTRFLLSIGLAMGSIWVSIGQIGQLKPQSASEKMVTDNYFGVTLEDPYRYLENLQDPAVVDWMKNNATYARAQINEVPERQNIIKKLNDFDKRKESTVYNLKITENDNYFYLKRNANEENGKLYYRTGYKGEEKLLFDPNNYKKNGSINYNISSLSPSDNGDKVAFEISPNGSESAELMIVDTNGKLFPEVLDKCWFSGPSWLPDGNSFTYNRLSSANVSDPERLLNSKVFYHKIGDDPIKDVEFLSNKTNPELSISSEEFPLNYYHKNSKNNYALVVTVDKRLKIYTAEGKNDFKPTTWKSLIEKKDEVVDFFVDRENIYFQTYKNAPNFKIVKVPLSNSNIDNATTVINEPKNGNITGFTVTKDGLYYVVSENGIQSKVYYLAKSQSTPIELKLPFTAGSANLSIKGEDYSDIWVTITGWTSPSKRYFYNPVSNTFTFQPLSKTVDYPEIKNIVAKEVMIPSHDGVMVPVSIIYNKNIKLNGENPILMMGYGAYGISIEPRFSTFILTYCSYDGIFVVPHVRGGGELGEAWHQAGQKATKPNTWKDFIASAEYLIREKYTNPKKIAILGGSAGGILIGRALTERPDLFAAVIPEVGCLNMLRAENSPNGPGNVPEFGTVTNEEDFKALFEMDSFHHIKKGTAYPATLITAGMNDPRVIAWEPAKFAAKLQNANSSENPILFYTDFDAGHGMGDSKSKSFESIGDLMSFAYRHTGHPKFQAAKKFDKP